MGSLGLILTACSLRYALFFPLLLTFLAMHLLSVACGMEFSVWALLCAGILMFPVAAAGSLAGQGADSILGLGTSKLFTPTAVVAALYLVLVTDIPIQIVAILAAHEQLSASQLIALLLSILGKLFFVITAVLLSLGGIIASFEFLLAWAVGEGQAVMAVRFARPLLVGFVFALSLQLLGALLTGELNPQMLLKDSLLVP
jgi:hypothetical protein